MFQMIKKNIFCCLVFGMLFILVSVNLVMKYMKKSTIMTESSEDDGRVLYPTISFCETAMYSKFTDHSLEGVNLTKEILKTENFSSWIQNNLWSRKESLQYLSHQGILKKNFPCNIVSGSQATLKKNPYTFT